MINFTFQCAVCCQARAVMQVSPCGHQALCRLCFVHNVRAHHMFSRILKLPILKFLFVVVFEKIGFSAKNNSYFDSWLKTLLAQIKTNGKFFGKYSGFLYSGIVKTCDELVTDSRGCGWSGPSPEMFALRIQNNSR